METLAVAPLFLLILAHYVADFGLQTEFMATMKGKVHTDPHGIHSLLGHSAIHGAMTVAALTVVGLPWFIPALLIILAHGTIDYFKSNHNSFGVHVDQALHMTSIVMVWMVALNL